MEQRSERTPQQNASGDTGIAREISLVRGGPFYRAQEAIRLLTPGQWNLGRRIAVAVGVGWAPLVVLTLLFKPHAMVGLLKEYPVNARMLIAVPVLLAGQMLMENVFRMVLRHIHEAELLSPPEQAKLDLAISRLVRWRDSIVAEVIIVAIAYLQVAIVFESRLQIAHAWALNDTGTGLHLSAAAWYYELVSQLIYLSLLGISLWKWLLWTRFLFVLARLDLELVPTHPDRHGGLGGNVSRGHRPYSFCRVRSDRIYLAESDPNEWSASEGFQNRCDRTAGDHACCRRGTACVLRPEAWPPSPHGYPAIWNAWPVAEHGVSPKMDTQPHGTRRRVSGSTGDQLPD
jgi:hypothetical protein